MLLTVVIPSYNCSSWIARAVQSTRHLSGCDIEVVVVDDGSTDDTQIVLEKLAGEVEFLRFYYKNNGGLSSARNFGVARSNGDYILFLDADDEVVPCDLKNLLNLGGDMIRIGVEEVSGDTPSLVQAESFGFMTGKEYLNLSFCRGSFYTLSCAYIYRAEWMKGNSLAFEDGLIHEDNLFTVQALLKADVVFVSPMLLYRYIKRDGSITTSCSEDDILSRIYAYKHIALRLASMANNDRGFDLRWKIYEVLGGAECLASRSKKKSTHFVVIVALLRTMACYRGAGWLILLSKLLRRISVQLFKMLKKGKHVTC